MPNVSHRYMSIVVDYVLRTLVVTRDRDFYLHLESKNPAPTTFSKAPKETVNTLVPCR